MRIRQLLFVAIFFQVTCAFFFAYSIFSSLLGFAPLAWHYREVIEVAAAAGLLLGIVLGVYALRRSEQRITEVESRLRLASGAFQELMDEKFTSWELTPAERDVALFSIKGLSMSEIAETRHTSEGTVKAQANAIYRKAGVTGRPQLLSLFLDDLMQGPL